MSDSTPRTDLAGYFGEISRRLQQQADVLTPIIVHHGEMGDNDHLWFMDLLRKHLPSRIGVDTGFVVNYESDKNSRDWFAKTEDHREPDESIGPQSDILLTDIQENAPLCAELAFRVCPVEMVLGVIEVTRKLDARKLALDLRKIQRVRELAAPNKKKYVQDTSATQRRPLAYLVGLRASITLNEIKNQLTDIADSLRPNAILLFDKALYVRRPYTLDFAEVTQNILFQFIAVLRLQIEGFPLGRTNLHAYLPPVTTQLVDEQ